MKSASSQLLISLRPHAAAQKELFEHLLAETGVSANDIRCVQNAQSEI